MSLAACFCFGTGPGYRGCISFLLLSLKLRLQSDQWLVSFEFQQKEVRFSCFASVFFDINFHVSHNCTETGIQ